MAGLEDWGRFREEAPLFHEGGEGANEKKDVSTPKFHSKICALGLRLECLIRMLPRIRIPHSNPMPLMDDISLPVQRLDHAEGLDLPVHETALSAGMDLRAAVPHDAPTTLDPGEWTLVPTGLKIALPAGYEAQIRPRSGLAYRHGVTVLNSPGTIDADYRGEVKVLLINHGPEPYTIKRGERIAQMVVARHATVSWQERDALEDTVRGGGGFGSTGTE
jgi:dUTP pyrophosphatase